MTQRDLLFNNQTIPTMQSEDITAIARTAGTVTPETQTQRYKR